MKRFALTVLFAVTFGFVNGVLPLSFGVAFAHGEESSPIQGLKLDERPSLPSSQEAPAARAVDLKGFFLPDNPTDTSKMEQALVAYLRDHPETFGGVDPSRQLRLDYLKIVPGRAGLTDMAYAHFEQRSGPLPVVGGRVTFSLKVSPKAKVTTLFSRLYLDVPIPSQMTLDKESAMKKVEERIKPLGSQASIKFLGSQIRFIQGHWRITQAFSIDFELTGLRAAVDSITGKTFVWDETLHLDVSGKAEGRGVFLDPGATGDNLDTLPLSDLKIQLSDGTEGYTDADGNFTLPSNGSSPIGISAKLLGRWANVIDKNNTPLQFNGTAVPGVPVRIAFSPTGNVETEVAQINAYYHVTRIHNWLVARGVNPTGINRPVETRVNYDPNRYYCNANAAGGVLRFPQHGGFESFFGTCRNTAYDTVIYHEYGHVVDLAIGGISHYGLSEGWGDLLAAYATGQPLIGESFYFNAEPLCGQWTTTSDITDHWRSMSRGEPGLVLPGIYVRT